MILADTSVWVDHIARPEAKMAALIEAQEILLHAMVIGELALGNLEDRDTRLATFAKLPRIEELENDAVLAKIEAHQIVGRGIGFVDAHLVFSALEREGTQLWTRDRRLHEVADELGVAFVESDGNREGDA